MDTTKPSLLFIHGAWHGKWCFERYFCGYFQQRGYDVHALDLPEHGEKFTGVRQQRWLSVRDYVTAVSDYAATLPTPPIVIGHSMGGFVVQKYLEQHPAPAGVLLASAPPSGVWRTTLKIARHYPRHFLQTNLSLSLWPLVNAPELAQAHFFSANISPADLQTYFQQLHSESYRAFVDMLLLNLPRPKRVKAPMLVLGAANDTIFTPQEVKATATAYHTEATIFPNMAHDMMLESGWQQVADAICTWLQGLGFAARKMS